MGYYVLTDGLDRFIRKDKTTKKYVPIRSEDAADHFDTKEKAENILRSSINKQIRFDFHVAYVDQTAALPAAITDKTDLIHRDITEDQISAWNDSLTAIQKIIDDSINRNDELNSQLSGIDKEITDIEHFIEFGNFNAYQGWMCFKILQGMLRQRRKYKNEMEVLTTIRNFGFNQQNLSSLKTKISEQNKVYKPRKFSELFVHTS